MQRGPTECILALALVHHLVIAGSISLVMLADFFRECCQNLLIEFVPKTDPPVKRLLSSRGVVLKDYSSSSFERAFARHFKMVDKWELADSGRVLYHYRLLSN